MTEHAPKRHLDAGKRKGDFLDDGVLIECPKCGGCGLLARVPHAQEPDAQWTPRFTCPSCAYVRDRDRPREAFDRNPMGPALGGDLWLRERCCGKELQIFNLAELEYLEAFVSATLRERDHREPASFFLVGSQGQQGPPIDGSLCAFRPL